MADSEVQKQIHAEMSNLLTKFNEKLMESNLSVENIDNYILSDPKYQLVDAEFKKSSLCWKLCVW